MEWIHSNNNLPEEGKYVMIWYNDEPHKACRDGQEWHFKDNEQHKPVGGTYWMEIIPPYDDRPVRPLIKFKDELPSYDKAIQIRFENGNTVEGKRVRHPIYEGEDAHVLYTTNVEMYYKIEMVGWRYLDEI